MLTATSELADVPGPWTHREAVVNGVRLHYIEAGAGSRDAPVVLLLHGFPEFWYAWRRQIPALAAAGFRVIAPDLRGYNTSGKPPRVRDYRVEHLAADVAALVRHAGAERAAVVGHDWGGVIAWHAAMHHPAAVERLVILNAPHPAAYCREVRRPAQLLRSWYAFAFQLPRLPEAVIRSRDFRTLRRLFRQGPLRKDIFSDEEIEHYVRAWSHPGALTAALNYYRAAFRRGTKDSSVLIRRVDCPTLLIWGEQDRYLVPELTEGLQSHVPRLQVRRLPDASHWLHHEQPDRINAMLIEFLRQPGVPPGAA